MRRLAAVPRLARLLFVCLAAGPAAAEDVPLGGGWVRTELAAGGRVLAAAMPIDQPSGEVLTIVIEGDGLSHDRRGRPTADPTPPRATGLEIARAWPTGPKAWLGRLCQYTAHEDRACAPADWTTGRFSPVAVATAGAAIDQLKAASGARRVRLVGWSGGGTLAMLVASGRADVAGVVTLAAPLDLEAWTRDRGLTPFDSAQDPARLPPMPEVPQAHLFGAFDPVVPPRTALEAARRLAGRAGRVEVWPERHACCWARRANKLSALAQAVSDGIAPPVEPAQEAAAAP